MWPWEQFLTQLAACVFFSLNFGSHLNWIFRKHPGEHSWESTSIHLEDAYSIASQSVFHWGKIYPMYLLKLQPAPHHTACPQINLIHNCLPKSFFQGTQPEENQWNSTRWLVQRKPVPNWRRPEFMGNGYFVKPETSYWNCQSIWNTFASQNQWCIRPWFPNFCRKLQSTVMWLEGPHGSHLFVRPDRWFSVPQTPPSHQLTNWAGKQHWLQSAPTSCACTFLVHQERNGEGGSRARKQELC